MYLWMNILKIIRSDHSINTNEITIMKNNSVLKDNIT